MNVSTSLIFFLENESKDICNQVMLGGSQALKQSTKIDKYGLSLREAFGLCVLSAHRAFLNPNNNWAFTTEPKISDDGAIVSLEGNKINYCELIEQVYLPGAYLKRTDGHSMNDHILAYISKTKDKGPEYFKDISLFILSDIQSGSSSDFFEWQDFAKRFYTKLPFLHVYFLGLTEPTVNYNSYYLFSFTNQKHRQNLNGEFSFKVSSSGIYDFKCDQEIDLLKPRG
jgi:hypothetical protein